MCEIVKEPSVRLFQFRGRDKSRYCLEVRGKGIEETSVARLFLVLLPVDKDRKDFKDSKVAFAKQVAMNGASAIGRQLAPLSPKIENFRGPQ